MAIDVPMAGFDSVRYLTAFRPVPCSCRLRRRYDAQHALPGSAIDESYVACLGLDDIGRQQAVLVEQLAQFQDPVWCRDPDDGDGAVDLALDAHVCDHRSGLLAGLPGELMLYRGSIVVSSQTVDISAAAL